MADSKSGSALADLRVLDLSRILAGPTCTQLMGDFGADIIKIEKPGAGDDTRGWGPPYLTGKDGAPLAESAYYVAANRNKRSVAVDISEPDGQAIIRTLLAHCDVLLENFKVGKLAEYGLGYDDLKDEFPGLIYCSITGFGQTGPYASHSGYDFVAQGMGGIMSITGQPGSEPTKVGVGIADQMCGMYACVAILSALRYRDRTGLGQHIDIGLLDTQIAWLANEGTNYLVSGEVPRRRGNEHPNIVPYKVFLAADSYVILAVGNDSQFRKFCTFADAPEVLRSARFATNSDRLHNRDEIYRLIEQIMCQKTAAEWIDGLSALGVPCSPVYDIQQVFEDPHVIHRCMRENIADDRSAEGFVPVIGNPVKFSSSRVQYRLAPPGLGQHTDEVLGELTDLDAETLASLKQAGIVETYRPKHRADRKPVNDQTPAEAAASRSYSE